MSNDKTPNNSPEDNQELKAPRKEIPSESVTETPVHDFGEAKKSFKIPKVLKWIAGMFGGLIVLLIALTLLIPVFVDFDSLRAKAIEQVKLQTGFDITLDKKIGFVSAPLPKITLHNVTVRAPKDAPDTPLLRAEELSVSVALTGLLSGDINISQISLRKGIANLRTYKDGTNNWTPVPQKTANLNAPIRVAQMQLDGTTTLNDVTQPDAVIVVDGEAKKLDLSIDEVILKDMRVTYGAGDAPIQDVRVDNGTLKMDELTGPYDIQLIGTAMKDQLTVDLSGDVGSIGTGDKATPVDIKLGTGQGDIILKGNAFLGLDSPQYVGTIDTNITNVSKLMKALNPKSAALPITKFAVKGDLKASASAIELTNSTIVFDEANGPLAINLTGLNDGNLRGVIKTNLKTDGFKLAQGFKTIALEGKFLQDNKTITLNPFTASLDGQQISGSFAQTGDVIAVNLKSPRLDVTPIAKNFDVKDLPELVLNNVALDARLKGEGAVINKLVIGDVKGVNVNASGKVDNFTSGEGARLDASLKAQNLLNALKQIPDLELPKEATSYLNGPGSADIDFAGNFAKGQLKATLTASNITAGIKGDVANITKEPKLGVLTLILAHPNGNGLVKMLSPETKLGTAFNNPVNIEAGYIPQDDGSFLVKDLNAKIAGTTLTGNLKIKTGDVAAVSGALNVGTIDVDKWFGAKETKTSAVNDPYKDIRVLAQAGGSSRWSKDPIDVSWMRSVALDLALSTGQLTTGDWTLSKPSFKIKMNGGNLNITDIAAGLLGGTLAGKVGVQSNADGVLNITSDLKAGNVQLDPLLRTVAKTGKVAEGTTNLDLGLTSSGKSPYDFVSNFNGNGTSKLDINSLIIYGINVDAIVNAVNAIEENDYTGALGLTATNFREGKSRFENASLPLTIKNGVLTWPETPLKSERLSVITKGTVDFLSWTLNVPNNVVVNTAEGRRIDAVQINTTGSLDNPKTKTDSSAITAKIQDKASQFIEKNAPEGVKDFLAPFLGGSKTPEKVVPITPEVTTPKVTTPAATTAAPAPAPTTTPAVYNAPAPTPDSGEPTLLILPDPATESTPAPESEAPQETTPAPE